MDSSKDCAWPLNISDSAGARWLLVAILAACGCVQQAGGQSPNSTIDDLLDDQIDQQVEDEITQSVEDAIQEQVEQQVEAGVAETVEQQIESGVVETIEQQVESGVTDVIQEQIEAGVEEAIEGTIDIDLETPLDEIDDLGESVEETIETAGQTPEESDDASSTDPSAFVEALDELGRAIEREVWVILVPSEHVAAIQGWGFTVRERRDLGALDRVLLRVDAPEDRDIVEAALELALDAPGTLVDFNHVYEGGNQTAASSGRIPGDAPLGRAMPGETHRLPALGIGLIDSAVVANHAALAHTAVEQKDFVPFEGPRPTRHGTAVASIMAAAAGPLPAKSTATKIWAASVFFRDASGNDAATTASLVAALDWLAGTRHVRVINMSLIGPANRVLEAALETVASRGLLVVAAVGNNGPAGEPLYPAAYDTVVGVTAVDEANRIYRYANRGRQVMFAAPGVEIEVASDAGGYVTESGTSMAAPHATVLIARALARDARPAAQVLAALQSKAVDLGEKHYDEVFGFGLISAVD
jgi:subtilisin family serine protease